MDGRVIHFSSIDELVEIILTGKRIEIGKKQKGRRVVVQSNRRESDHYEIQCANQKYGCFLRRLLGIFFSRSVPLLCRQYLLLSCHADVDFWNKFYFSIWLVDRF